MLPLKQCEWSLDQLIASLSDGIYGVPGMAILSNLVNTMNLQLENERRRLSY